MPCNIDVLRFFLLFYDIFLNMVDFDKRFLFKQIKLAIIGKNTADIKVSLEYLGFKDITTIRDTSTASDILYQEAFGLIVIFDDCNKTDISQLVGDLRRKSGAMSRFSPILAILPCSGITKEFVAKLRDSGVNEIAAYPTTTISLRDKISVMLEQPRNFIISRGYMGPDRRRKKLNVESERRKES